MLRVELPVTLGFAAPRPDVRDLGAFLVAEVPVVRLPPEVGDKGASTLGDGGLQKWVFSGGSWNLEYTLAAGLNLVANPTTNTLDTSGTTGLLGLTGLVVGGDVELFATNFTIGDTDQTYLYGITDSLATEPALTGYHHLPSVRADLLTRLGRYDEAAAEFRRAASLTRNIPERTVLLQRAAECDARS